MSDDEINIAIAEVLGWKRKKEFDYTSHLDPVFSELGERVEMWGRDDGRLVPFRLLPKYCNDLNACHEFEETLTAPQSERYAEFILDVLKIPTPFIGTARCAFLTNHAKARIRSEAFLRCLNLWKQS